MEEKDGWLGGDDADPPGEGGAPRSYWARNLPQPPEEAERVRLRGAQDSDQEIQWDLWYSSHPFWKRQRVYNLLVFLGLAVVLFLVFNPLGALKLLAPPEDPPLRLVRADQVTREEASATWVRVPQDTQVPPGSLLRSGGGRTAVLRVRGGGSLRLDAGTGLKIERLVRREDDSYQVRSMLYVGRAFVRELSTDTLPVETPLTRIEPEDATYEIRHDPAPEGEPVTTVRVFAGRVRVGLARGRLEDVTLRAGQEIRVRPDRLGEVTTPPPPDPWEAWNLSWIAPEDIPPFAPPGTTQPARTPSGQER